MRMRFAPDGPFVKQEPSTQGPLEQGPGTPGLVYHGIGQGPLQVLLGAGVPLELTWRHPLSGLDTQILPWPLYNNLFWEVKLDAWVQASVAAPGGSLLARVRAADSVTSVVSTVVSDSYVVPNDFTLWPVTFFWLVDGTAFANNMGNVRVEVEGAVTLGLVSLLTALTVTQYVP